MYSSVPGNMEKTCAENACDEVAQTSNISVFETDGRAVKEEMMGGVIVLLYVVFAIRHFVGEGEDSHMLRAWMETVGFRCDLGLIFS